MSFADFATKKIATNLSNQNNLNLEDPATRQMLIEQLGLQDQKPQLNALERIIAPLDMFRITDDIRKAQKEGVLAGIGDFFMDIPKAIGGAITGEDFRDKYDKEGAGEILKDMGASPFLQGVGGFVGDVLLDPTTYITVGTGAGAKILTKAGAKTLTKAGTKLMTKVEGNLVKEFAEKSIDDIAKVAAENGLEEVFKLGGKGGLIRELTSKKMLELSEKGGKVLTSLGVDESNKLLQQVLKEGVIDQGGFKFMGKKIFNLTPKTEGIAKAYIDPVSTLYKGAKKLPFGIGGTVEKVGTGIGGAIKKTVGGVRSLFDRKYALADGNMAKYGQLLESADQVRDHLAGIVDTTVKKYRGTYENVIKAIDDKDIAALPHLLEQLPEYKIRELPTEIQESINRLMTETTDAIKYTKDIEPSVVQTKDINTGKISYMTIPKGKLDEANKLIDQGIAGETIDGKIWHLTAKTPDQMDKAGAEFAGEYNADLIPNGKTTAEQIVNESEGFTDPKLRERFDTALVEKDAKTIQELLPIVPKNYKQKFAKDIDEILLGKVDEGLSSKTEGILKDIEKGMPEKQALLEEARKYKTPEEFIEAQGSPIYHGTGEKFNEFDITKRGINEQDFQSRNAFFFTDSMETARSYGENIQERYGKFEKPLVIDAEGAMYSGGSSNIDMKEVVRESVEKAQKEGNDVVIIKNLSDRKDWGNYEPATHYAVLDINKLQTRSKLEDVWNKAQVEQAAKQVESPLNRIGKFKNIVNKDGVKKKVFDKALTDKQIEVLNSVGIVDGKSMEKFVKNKWTFIPEDIPYTETKETVKQMSWARAGKQKSVKTIADKVESIKSNPTIQKVMNEFDANEKMASQMGYDDSQTMADALKSSVDETEQEWASKLEKTYTDHEKIQNRLQELQQKYDQELKKAYENSREVTKTTVQLTKAGMTPYDKLIKDMGVTPSKFKDIESKIIKAGKQAEEFAKKSEEMIEKKITDVKKFVDPKLQNWFDESISTATERSDWLVEHGYLAGKPKATYLGREVTKTPSGKIIDKLGKEVGVPNTSIKKMLDPRSAIQTKHRSYDYLADLTKAGGETTITKETGKKQGAAIVEQMAKDEIKYQTAVQFEGFAKSIADGKITDAAGNKLYYQTSEILDAIPDKLKGLNKQVDHFRATGEMGEALKKRLDSLGYKQIDLPVFKDAWFDEESYKVISKIKGAFFNDEAMNDFVKLYDKVHGLIKRSQTVWFPAFHVRNAMSNVFVNLTAGVTNPLRYTDAITIQQYTNALDSGKKELIKSLGEKKIGTFTVSELYNLAKYNGVTSSNFYSEMAEDLVGKKSLVNKANKLNPFSSEFALQKGGRLIEDNARLALFVDRMLKGDDIRSAALKVKEVLFDYSDLTDFEKNVLKRFVPYYTWTRKNAEQMIKMIALQPSKFATIMKAYKSVNQMFSNLSQEDIDKLPDWAKSGLNIGRTAGGDQATIITSFGLPIEAFEQLLTTNPLNQLGVLPKTVIEVGTGKNIFKNKDILDDNTGQAYKKLPQFIKDRIGYREETRTTKDGRTYTLYTVDPWAKYYMNVLFGRSVSTASKGLALGESGDTTMDLVNLLSGVKKYDFDLTAEAEKRNREQTQKLYDSLSRMGLSSEYTSQYMSKDQKSDLLKRIGQ